jgi:predicted nucleotidyltransferase
LVVKEEEEEEMNQYFPSTTVLAGYRGSIAHGMYVPNTDPNSIDDIDVMGIHICPPEFYIGLANQRKEGKRLDVFEIKEGVYDMVFYELRKYIHLLIKSNPNVLSLLWLREQDYLVVKPYGQILLDNRDLFVSKKIYEAFTSYAFDQLRKMEKFNHQGYMGEKRKKLVEKYGYDCKNAAHCLRLLTMGIEFLQEGKLNVYREKDAYLFIDVKMGRWPLDEVHKYAAELFMRAEEALKKCTLPEEPPIDKIEKMLINILYDYLTSECNWKNE